jgi:signal transduction histidine kinase
MSEQDMTGEDQGNQLGLLRKQTILARFGELALRSDDLEEILTEACRLVGEALDTDLAKIVELQEDGQTLLVRAGVGWKSGIVGKVTIRVEDDTSEGLAFKTGEPMISPDIDKETRFRYPPFLTENGVRAVANVLIIGGKDRPPFGILQVDSREPRQFTDADTVFLRSYANLVAAAVDRLRVIGDVRDGKEALQRSHEALEARVAERTRELVEANDKLRTEAKERERIEEQLRQSQKMEAVGQLTGGLAHDFNNLLAGISGSLELLQLRMRQGRIHDVERYITAAQDASKRAAALTHRLLAFARRQTLDAKLTDINHLIVGMEELVCRTVGPEVTVEVVTADGLWNTLVDPNQLENALLNLCINAHDAMPDGGKLMVETANKSFDEHAARERDLPAGQYVSLCVSDNGTGMTPDIAAHAFDPFYTTKPIGMGTGLGLSMIYGFVRQSGGQARIYSEPGAGTTVCLYLPRQLGDAEQVEAPAEMNEAPRAKDGETVLVVDDEPTVRMLVIDVLEDLGYIAIEASDGATGLRLLHSDARIDLLITDLGLPGGMNGRQLANAARERRRDLKVLFITGYTANAALSHGHLDLGMHVVAKPFAIEALASRIRDLITGS